MQHLNETQRYTIYRMRKDKKTQAERSTSTAGTGSSTGSATWGPGSGSSPTGCPFTRGRTAWRAGRSSVTSRWTPYRTARTSSSPSPCARRDSCSWSGSPTERTPPASPRPSSGSSSPSRSTSCPSPPTTAASSQGTNWSPRLSTPQSSSRILTPPGKKLPSKTPTTKNSSCHCWQKELFLVSRRNRGSLYDVVRPTILEIQVTLALLDALDTRLQLV